MTIKGCVKVKSRKIRIYLAAVLLMVVFLGLLIYFYVLKTEQPLMEGTMVLGDEVLWNIKI